MLVPDFRGRLDRALDILVTAPPDVMNHNLETVPRLYRKARPGSDYLHSLRLLKEFKLRVPGVPTKSGLMLGLGETNEEIVQVMHDLRAHDVDMITIGQYLAPSTAHLPVLRYVSLEEFAFLRRPPKTWALPMLLWGPLYDPPTMLIIRPNRLGSPVENAFIA